MTMIRNACREGKPAVDTYTKCDQCARECPVESLRCENGKRRYQEVTGREYVPTKPAERDDGAAYRKLIRERRARRRREREQQEECLICKAPLEYLDHDEPMTCAICHKTFPSKARCVKGHYVCDECHTAGLDSIVGACLGEASKDPVYIIEKMMRMPFCHMHGPEHHVMVGAALLTAFRNAGGEIDLEASLNEMLSRGRRVPGGTCGFWGACGAYISTGMFVSIVSKSTPLTEEPFALSNHMTATSLESVAKVGGPRCCKRDSFLSILAAIEFAREHFGVEMERRDIVCTWSAKNNQCIGARCPFSAAHAPHRPAQPQTT